MLIFGYGSLMWKQGFEYEEKQFGYIKGFKRRFWHGSEDHRGVPGAPGRVVSVSPSEDPEEKVYGVTFRIHPNKQRAVRANLIERETGYEMVSTLFYPVQPCGQHPIELEIFMATSKAPTYLGPATEKAIAHQIYHAHGKCGPNVEYLMKLIWFHKNLFPHDKDPHLNELEEEIHLIAKSKGHKLGSYSLHEF